jgi:hypothetical protein
MVATMDLQLSQSEIALQVRAMPLAEAGAQIAAE